MERFQSACVSADAQMNISAEPAPALGNEKASFLADGMLIVVLLAVANFLLHLYFNNRYGYFRDEFDYMSRSEEHTSELQSQSNLVCRLLLEKKKKLHSLLLLNNKKK